MNPLTSRLRSLYRAAAVTFVTLLTVSVVLTAQAPPSRAPGLPAGCEALQVPPGHVVTLHTYAIGVQIYRWNATTSSWSFVGPLAQLYPSAACAQPLGVHFVGPTWVVQGGSTAVGSVVAAQAVDPTAIPWLLLSATSFGPGVLSGTTFIQRVHTVGGRAPARVGLPDEIVQVPYAAEYFFYRAL